VLLQVLAAEVASYLGLELGKIKIKRFADGEIYVQVQVRHSSGSGSGRSSSSSSSGHGSGISAAAALGSLTDQLCYGAGCDKSSPQLSTPPHGSVPAPHPLHSLCCFLPHLLWLCLQESIRGCDVFLMQPTCPPVNDNLMELLVTIDACRRASARSITAVLPYYGYARADRKTQVRATRGCRGLLFLLR
jgi:hypothetical protein